MPDLFTTTKARRARFKDPKYTNFRGNYLTMDQAHALHIAGKEPFSYFDIPNRWFFKDNRSATSDTQLIFECTPAQLLQYWPHLPTSREDRKARLLAEWRSLPAKKQEEIRAHINGEPVRGLRSFEMAVMLYTKAQQRGALRPYHTNPAHHTK